MRRALLAGGSLVSVAAVATLATGVTYGLFSAAAPGQPATFTAGTVKAGSTLTGTCTLSNLLPTGVPSTCGLQATYSGSAPAHLALDVLIVTRAGVGGLPLYNPSDAGGLQVAISSTNPTVAAYALPVTSTPCPVGTPSGSTCYEIDSVLVSTTPFTEASPAVTFSTRVSLPTTSPSGYQGGSAQIVLNAHAVQSAHNAPVSGCIAGQPCSTASWS